MSGFETNTVCPRCAKLRIGGRYHVCPANEPPSGSPKQTVVKTAQEVTTAPKKPDVKSARIITILENEMAELRKSMEHPWASKARFRFAIDTLRYVIAQAQAIHDESHDVPT